MGCCNSTPADGPETANVPSRPQTRTYANPSSASQSGVINSQTAITSAPRPIGPLSVANSNSRSNISTPRPSSPSENQPSRLPLSASATRPLLAPEPWSSGPTRVWTPSTIARERSDFFETRVTGRSESWAALRSVCELIRSGEIDTAQGILEASGVTLPTGSLLDGAYDSLGNLYRLPPAVLTDPTDMAEETHGHTRSTSNIDGETILGDAETKAATMEGGGDEGKENSIANVEDEEALEKRREEKGKTVERDAVKVRCRLSDRGGPDVVITLGKAQTVGTLIRRVMNETTIPSNSRVRIAYLGHILNDKETLTAQGWKEGHVLNGLVSGIAPVE